MTNPLLIDFLFSTHFLTRLSTAYTAQRLTFMLLLSQKHYRDRSKQPPPAFAMNDKVMLSTNDLLIRVQVCPKLKKRYVGPFTVIECINPQVYRLE
jgi:hypothetical protein